MIYIENVSTNPYFNLAAEEALLNEPLTDDEEPILLLWRNVPTVVVGVHQNALEEIDREFVEKNGVFVARRSTGGGAVYHDLGNLNYSFLVPNAFEFSNEFYRSSFKKDSTFCDKRKNHSLLVDSFQRLTQPIVDVLRDWNVPAQTSGRNDVVVGGKKISGSAQVRKNGKTLHHGTLLVDANLENVASALKADPEKFRSKAISSVRSRVGNVVDFLPDARKPNALARFQEALKEKLSESQILVKREFTIDELRAIERLRDEKYSTWDWNFGAAPRFQYRNARRFDWGKFELAFDVERGRVVRAQILGDFFELRDLAPLVARIVGAPFERDALKTLFSDDYLKTFLPRLSQRDFLGVLFGD